MLSVVWIFRLLKNSDPEYMKRLVWHVVQEWLQIACLLRFYYLVCKHLLLATCTCKFSSQWSLFRCIVKLNWNIAHYVENNFSILFRSLLLLNKSMVVILLVNNQFWTSELFWLCLSRSSLMFYNVSKHQFSCLISCFLVKSSKERNQTEHFKLLS